MKTLQNSVKIHITKKVGLGQPNQLLDHLNDYDDIEPIKLNKKSNSVSHTLL